MFCELKAPFSAHDFFPEKTSEISFQRVGFLFPVGGKGISSIMRTNFSKTLHIYDTWLLET